LRNENGIFVPQIHGDEVLSHNVGSVCVVISGYIVEYMDLCRCFLGQLKRSGICVHLDYLIRIQDDPDICYERCLRRREHGFPERPFSQLDKAISQHVKEYLRLVPDTTLVTLSGDDVCKVLTMKDERRIFIEHIWMTSEMRET
jgi:hypothetical protein